MPSVPPPQMFAAAACPEGHDSAPPSTTCVTVRSGRLCSAYFCYLCLCPGHHFTQCRAYSMDTVAFYSSLDAEVYLLQLPYESWRSGAVTMRVVFQYLTAALGVLRHQVKLLVNDVEVCTPATPAMMTGGVRQLLQTPCVDFYITPGSTIVVELVERYRFLSVTASAPLPQDLLTDGQPVGLPGTGAPTEPAPHPPRGGGAIPATEPAKATTTTTAAREEAMISKEDDSSSSSLVSLAGSFLSPGADEPPPPPPPALLSSGASTTLPSSVHGADDDDDDDGNESRGQATPIPHDVSDGSVDSSTGPNHHQRLGDGDPQLAGGAQHDGAAAATPPRLPFSPHPSSVAADPTGSPLDSDGGDGDADGDAPCEVTGRGDQQDEQQEDPAAAVAGTIAAPSDAVNVAMTRLLKKVLDRPWADISSDTVKSLSDAPPPPSHTMVMSTASAQHQLHAAGSCSSSTWAAAAAAGDAEANDTTMMRGPHDTPQLRRPAVEGQAPDEIKSRLSQTPKRSAKDTHHPHHLSHTNPAALTPQQATTHRKTPKQQKQETATANHDTAENINDKNNKSDSKLSPSNVLHIKFIPKGLSGADLTTLLAPFAVSGPFELLHRGSNDADRSSVARPCRFEFALVEYPTIEEATRAKKALDRHYFHQDGLRLSVNFSKGPPSSSSRKKNHCSSRRSDLEPPQRAADPQPRLKQQPQPPAGTSSMRSKDVLHDMTRKWSQTPAASTSSSPAAGPIVRTDGSPQIGGGRAAAEAKRPPSVSAVSTPSAQASTSSGGPPAAACIGDGLAANSSTPQTPRDTSQQSTAALARTPSTVPKPARGDDSSAFTPTGPMGVVVRVGHAQQPPPTAAFTASMPTMGWKPAPRIRPLAMDSSSAIFGAVPAVASISVPSPLPDASEGRAGPSSLPTAAVGKAMQQQLTELMEAEGRLAGLIGDVLTTAERCGRDVLAHSTAISDHPSNNNNHYMSHAGVGPSSAYLNSRAGGAAAAGLQQRHLAAEFIGSTVGSLMKLLRPMPLRVEDHTPLARLPLLKLATRRIETVTKLQHAWLLQIAVLMLPLASSPVLTVMTDAVDSLADAARMALLRLYSAAEALTESLALAGLLPICRSHVGGLPSSPNPSAGDVRIGGATAPPVTVAGVEEAVVCGSAIAAAAKLCQQLFIGGLLVEPQQPSAAGQAYRAAVALASRLLGPTSAHTIAMSRLLSAAGPKNTSSNVMAQGTMLLPVTMPHVDCFPALLLCGRAEVALYTV